MSEELYSVLVWCRDFPETNAVYLRIVNVNSGETLHFEDGSFLLHMTVDTNTAITRCLIRHISSGSEAHVQTGPNMQAFIRNHLFKKDDDKPLASDQGKDADA